ncbi:MAG: transporter substrate-binding domain-containing protein [Gammaproteobacteria bacterium]|nr:transporter substrate-binding domain-containing protein [Gammaproteobacteria bacterium]
MSKRRDWFLVLCLLLPSLLVNATAAPLPKKIILATTDWCPYACPGDPQTPGIAHEYITQVLADLGVDVEIKFYPWSRAIREVSLGRSHGLLTAVHDEAPDFLFTRTPTMAYSMCFFSKQTKDWEYMGIKSLEAIRFGGIKGYGYSPEINGYMEYDNSQTRVELISGGNEIPRLFQMIKHGRIDAFIEDKYVVAWSAKKNSVDMQDFKKAGCLKEIPFFMAFNPDFPWVMNVLKQLDSSFLAAKNKTILKRIVERYTGY